MIHPISAAAGSGKTFLLTRRFLSLLQDSSTQPRLPACLLSRSGQSYSLAEILAATFTNKAAAEMKNRVVQTLKEQALVELRESPRDGQNQRMGGAGFRLGQILRHYNSLNIRTIDSLLTMLVRLSAMDLGLPPDFTPSFDPEEYFTPLYDALMEDIKTGLNVFAAGADARALTTCLEEACRGQLYSDFHGFLPKGRVSRQVLELTRMLLRGKQVPVTETSALHEALHIVHADVVAASRELSTILHNEKLKGQANFLALLERCLESSPYSTLPDSVYTAKSCLDECVLKASRGLCSAEADKAYERLCSALSRFSHDLPALKAALQLAPLAQLAHEMYARIQVTQRERGLIPVVSLPILAGAVLSGEYGVSDALCRMGSRLTHIMLDEFQDTSREQWAALLPLAVECLSTGGSLAYVGDVKQAIYGWRGGDARLFAQLSHEPELCAIEPEPCPEVLPFNWRSHPHVVQFNNAFFSMLAEESTALATLSAMLPKGTPYEYRQDAARQAKEIFHGCSQAVPEEKQWIADPLSEQAGVTLSIVTGHCAEDVCLQVENRLRTLLLDDVLHAWRPGDVAILVRSSREGRRIAQALSSWGQPVVTEDSFSLNSHPLIHSLVSFLTFLDYPLDDAAFFTTVSSPDIFSGTGCPQGTELTDWLAECQSTYPTQRPPLYRLFRSRFPNVWRHYFVPFVMEAGIMSAYDILVEIMARFSLFTRLPTHASFLRRLLEIAHSVENSGRSSSAAFLAYWRQHGDKEQLPMPESMDAIRVMTIHKAKGLEFPVVILPFHHTAERGEPQPTAYSLHGVPVLTRNGSYLPELYYPARIMEELERLNLLYVAWTRPVYRLHAFITRPARTTPLSQGLETLLNSFIERSLDHLCHIEIPGAECEDATGIDPKEDREGRLGEDTATQGTQADVPPVAYDPAEDWRPMAWLPRLKIFRSNPEDTEFGPRQRGIFAHLCLEHLCIREPRTPQSLTDDVEQAVRQAMRLSPLALGLEEISDGKSIRSQSLGDDLRECLTWFANLPHATLWLARGRREQGIIDESGRMRRVDLLVAPDHQGDLLAIDYKTGHVSEDSRQSYRVQVSRYMSLLNASTGRQTRGLIVYLDHKSLEYIDLGDAPSLPSHERALV